MMITGGNINLYRGQLLTEDLGMLYDGATAQENMSTPELLNFCNC